MTAVADPPKERTGASIGSGNLLQTMELREFLLGLAVVMRLPRRSLQKPRAEGGAPQAVATPAAVASPRRIPGWVYASAAAALVAGVAVVQLVPRAATTSVELPIETYGRWVTKHPRYAKRSFQLDGSSVTLQTGPESSDYAVHEIRRVERKREKGVEVIRVYYEDRGNTIEMAFSYSPSPKPQLRLINQPEVAWTHP